MASGAVGTDVVVPPSLALLREREDLKPKWKSWGNQAKLSTSGVQNPVLDHDGNRKGQCNHGNLPRYGVAVSQS